MSFLTKRVGEDKTDKKLTRVANYMHRTKLLRLTIEAKHLDQNQWFIDAAFTVHNNMQSRTGAYATFGKGTINGSATGQRINTISSTEGEVVGVYESIPAILWMRCFLVAQGYPFQACYKSASENFKYTYEFARIINEGIMGYEPKVRVEKSRVAAVMMLLAHAGPINPSAVAPDRRRRTP